jgi:predicted AlkP superfamily pyrophosphatase or phosphodiesterase
MMLPSPPSYDGRGLVNLVAELETRLTNSSAAATLDGDLSDLIPAATTYVMVLFDGLGVHQLKHPNASDLRAASSGVLDAPFPSMTTVSLATVATGLPPSQHGLIAYKLWLADLDTIVNTIHMTSVWGDEISGVDFNTFLPSNNLWERLRASGVEPIVVQPGDFEQTNLTKTLYRGARFEGYWSPDEAVKATVDLAGAPDRFVFLYIPFVDFAAHIAGQQSTEYQQAMRTANQIWSSLSARLPNTVGLTGTADHGHVDIDESHRHRISSTDLDRGFVAEDGRVLFVHGDGDGSALADRFSGIWHRVAEEPYWWGPGPFHPDFINRAPTGVVFLPRDRATLTGHGNPRLVGHHGGLSDAERQVPLLLRRSDN